MEEEEEIGNQRVILMNIYHMETFFKLDEDLHSQLKIIIASESYN
jgi:hypothetical protein